MVDISPKISIIALNVNGLNASIKRQRLSDWIKKSESKLRLVVNVYCKFWVTGDKGGHL